MKGINIPKPCHENWNEMIPTEKGAFCQKCALDVHDFTNKSGAQIREILTVNIGGNVCGRINPKQLESLNDDFLAWKASNSQSYRKAWIFTLFVVFGLSLFSCEEDEVKVVKEIQKTAQAFLIQSSDEMQIPESTPNKTEISVVSNKKNTETEPYHSEFAPSQEDITSIQNDFEEVIVLSDVIVAGRSQATDRIQGMLQPVATRGAVQFISEYETYLIDSTEIIACETKLSGLVYPNPASNQTTLKVQMPEKGKVRIELYGLNGQNIQTIHAGRIQKGETEFPIDLTGVKTGSYLVIIQSNDSKETIKLTKI